MRPPDEFVGPPHRPQTRRWILFRCRWFQICLHHHMRSDVPVLHDHEWPNVSVVLSGLASEVCGPIASAVPPYLLLPVRWLTPGSVRFRRAADLHYLSLPPGSNLWTLFITGPKVREWGYLRADGRWSKWNESPDVLDMQRFRRNER